MSKHQKKVAREYMTTHGGSYTTEYNSWREMKARCYGKYKREYSNYGGRGITVCDKWRKSFSDFLTDMGKKPSPKHSLDRIDNSLGYFPENCRWATRFQQNRNNRRTHMITYNGETMCVTDWAKKIGISVGILFGRIHLGWEIKDILETPKRTSERLGVNHLLW